jgi:hypothetical protein
MDWTGLRELQGELLLLLHQHVASHCSLIEVILGECQVILSCVPRERERFNLWYFSSHTHHHRPNQLSPHIGELPSPPRAAMLCNRQRKCLRRLPCRQMPA